MANTAPRSVVRVITPNKEQGREKNSAAKEKVSSVVESWEKKREGRWGWWVIEESVSVTLFYLMLLLHYILYVRLIIFVFIFLQKENLG